MRKFFWKFARVLSIASLTFASAALAQSDPCQKGSTLFHARRWAEAASAFSECESISPGKTDALLYRGKALVNVPDFAGAAESLESYVASHPTSDDALYLLAYTRFRQDKPKDSLDLLTRAAKIRAPEAGDLKVAALDYVLLNDYTDAAKYLELSLQMNPADAEALYHLGRVRYQQNKFDAAIAAFEAVLRQEPGNVKAQENLGLCLEAENRNQEALAAYRQAVDLDAQSAVRNAQPYIDLGKLLNTLDCPEEAAPLLSTALKIQPESPAAHYELGRAYFLAGKFDDARQQLETAVRLDPAKGAPHYLLGRVYSRMGKSEQAAAEFKVTEELVRQKNARSGGMETGR
jgi:tetratricopeptide (TPR) repeat protein